MKNFSYGMVNCLGFAIATAGDAAEILILDEVLSVRDEFFRKKSLKRIKECKAQIDLKQCMYKSREG